MHSYTLANLLRSWYRLIIPNEAVWTKWQQSINLLCWHKHIEYHAFFFMKLNFREVVGSSHVDVSNFLALCVFSVSFGLISVAFVVLELLTSKKCPVSYSWPWQSYMKMKLKGRHCVLTNQQLQRWTAQKYHRGKAYLVQECVCQVGTVLAKKMLLS